VQQRIQKQEGKGYGAANWLQIISHRFSANGKINIMR